MLFLPFFTHTSQRAISYETADHSNHSIVRPIPLYPSIVYVPPVPFEDVVCLHRENVPFHFRPSTPWGINNCHGLMARYRQILLISMINAEGQLVCDYVGSFSSDYRACNQNTTYLHRLMFNNKPERRHRIYFGWNLSSVGFHPKYYIIQASLAALASYAPTDFFSREIEAQRLLQQLSGGPRSR